MCVWIRWISRWVKTIQPYDLELHLNESRWIWWIDLILSGSLYNSRIKSSIVIYNIYSLSFNCAESVDVSSVDHSECECYNDCSTVNAACNQLMKCSSIVEKKIVLIQIIITILIKKRVRSQFHSTSASLYIRHS